MYPQYKIYQDGRKQWRWTYYAANGEEIAVSSEAYKAVADCEAAIALIKTDGATAQVVRDEKVIEGKLKPVRSQRRAKRKARR